MDKLKDTIKYVLFDLDGTISDSSEGITKSVQLALAAEGIHEELSALTKCIGPSLRYSFSQYTDDAETAERMLAAYRKRYSEIGWMENKMYSGMETLFKNLKQAGKHIVLASAKPELFCNEILKYFGVYEYFDFIGGATMDGSRDDKAVLIKYTLDSIGNPPKDSVIMVGDRFYDVEGAHKNGLKVIGVKFGFARENELETACADYIVDTVSDLQALLLL